MVSISVLPFTKPNEAQRPLQQDQEKPLSNSVTTERTRILKASEKFL
jgi:hypothetical protein